MGSDIDPEIDKIYFLNPKRRSLVCGCAGFAGALIGGLVFPIALIVGVGLFAVVFGCMKITAAAIKD